MTLMFARIVILFVEHVKDLLNSIVLLVGITYIHIKVPVQVYVLLNIMQIKTLGCVENVIILVCNVIMIQKIIVYNVIFLYIYMIINAYPNALLEPLKMILFINVKNVISLVRNVLELVQQTVPNVLQHEPETLLNFIRILLVHAYVNKDILNNNKLYVDVNFYIFFPKKKKLFIYN